MTMIYSPTTARQNLYAILRQVNESHDPAFIGSGRAKASSSVILSQQDYESLLETVELVENGQLSDALARMRDPQPLVDSEAVDWDTL